MATARAIAAADIEAVLPTSVITDTEMTAAIGTHNTATAAHADIRALIAAIDTAMTALNTALAGKLSAVPASIPGDKAFTGNTVFSGTVNLNGGVGLGAPIYGTHPVLVNYLPYGAGNTAVAASFQANTGAPAQIGYDFLSTPSRLADTAERAKVGLYAGISSIAPTVDITNATYTATTIVPATPLTAPQVAAIKYGMLIDTKHSPKRSGVVTGRADDGTSITVLGWFAQGNTAANQVPANGVGAIVNPTSKIWGFNCNAFLLSEGDASEAATLEIGTFNAKKNPSTANDPAVTCWGVDVTTLPGVGGFPATKHYTSRNGSMIGFSSESAIEGGFVVENAVQNPVYGFKSTQITGQPFGYVYGNSDERFAVSDQGSLRVGSKATAMSSAIEFFNGFTQNSVRISGSGGGAANLSGTFNVESAAISLNSTTGTFYMGGSGSIELGAFSGGAQLTTLDIHNGFNNDFGMRLALSGGSATDGSSNVAFTANNFTFNTIGTGVMTIAGGAWNQNHIVIGTLHLVQRGKQLVLFDGTTAATGGAVVGTAP